MNAWRISQRLWYSHNLPEDVTLICLGQWGFGEKKMEYISIVDLINCSWSCCQCSLYNFLTACHIDLRFHSYLSRSGNHCSTITWFCLCFASWIWCLCFYQGKDYPSKPIPPQCLDICTIMYTSGTSGNPKGVVLTHDNHAMYVRSVDAFMDQFEEKVRFIWHLSCFFFFKTCRHLSDAQHERHEICK